MSEDQNIDQVVNGELCLLREAERERESDKSDTASKKKKYQRVCGRIPNTA